LNLLIYMYISVRVIKNLKLTLLTCRLTLKNNYPTGNRIQKYIQDIKKTIQSLETIILKHVEEEKNHDWRTDSCWLA